MYVRVYPACAGIHPSYSKPTRLNQRLPRMRGDPPNGYSGTLEMALSTPHARGSTLVRPFRDLRSGVYPACAGIHPLESGKRLFGKGLPRMRGDPPRRLTNRFFVWVSTPHARGSTLPLARNVNSLLVYPACAGIHHHCGNLSS